MNIEFNVEFEELNHELDVEFDEIVKIVTDDHAILKNRDINDQHPISAISGLDGALNRLNVEVSNKLDKLVDYIPGALVVTNNEGKLESSNLDLSEFIKAEDIITGVLASNVVIGTSGQTKIMIPNSVKSYPDILVYCNGKLLAKDINYTVVRNSIVLNDYYTYDGDVFIFVGYGSTIQSQNETPTSGHIHNNKTALDQITEDSIEQWNASINSIKVNGSLIPVEDRTVNIPIASKGQLGVVKSSEGLNTIRVKDDGSMYVHQISVENLVIPEDQELQLECGASN